MQHFYRQVPGLGNVALSRHAQARADEEGFSDEMVRKALLEPDTPDIPAIPDGHNILFRSRGPLRFVINRRPTPFRHASLVTTIIRIQPQARTK